MCLFHLSILCSGCGLAFNFKRKRHTCYNCVPGSRIVPRATSPISRRPSPPRSTTPTPTLGGLTSPKNVVDEARRTNESLSQEVTKLRAQVESLTRKSQFQESELERTTKQLKEAIAMAGEETAKCKAANEVIKSLTAQLQDVAERLPVEGTPSVKSPSFTYFEQDEPGVYITLMSLPGGGKDLKRVRFSRKLFSEKQAEQWWAENRARVYERYNVRMIDK